MSESDKLLDDAIEKFAHASLVLTSFPKPTPDQTAIVLQSIANGLFALAKGIKEKR